MTFLITYDLDKPGQNYSSVIAAIRNLGGIRVQLSSWLLTTEAGLSALDLTNHLLKSMDANDRLIVAEVTSNMAWYRRMDQDPVTH